MLVKKHRSKVISIENLFDNIYSIELESLGKSFKFMPGQFLHLALDNSYDGTGQWPESRCFSIQTNPSEKNIRITYAVKGDFTTQMKSSLKLNSEVWLKLPYGDFFTQSHSKKDTVFIAGGTGITPFLSLFTDESFSDYINPKIYLGFRSKDHFLYENEIQQIKNTEASIKYFYQDIAGVIDIDKIFNENSTGCCYFISGTPEMIKSFKEKLCNYGVPANQILSDDWE